MAEPSPYEVCCRGYFRACPRHLAACGCGCLTAFAGNRKRRCKVKTRDTTLTISDRLEGWGNDISGVLERAMMIEFIDYWKPPEPNFRKRLALFPWRIIGYRWLAWHFAGTWNTTIGFFKKYRQRFLVLVAVVFVLFLWLLPCRNDGFGLRSCASKSGFPFKSWSDVMVLLLLAASISAVYLIMEFGFLTFHRRKGLLIRRFQNHTGDARLKEQVDGLPARLLCEINQLTSILSPSLPALQRDIRESKNDAALRSASIQIIEPGEAIKGAVTFDPKIGIGPLSIPFGFLSRYSDSLERRPRLDGSLHREGNRFLLAARYSEGPHHYHWRTTATGPLDSLNITDDMQRMIQELAFRIFTDLVDVGSREWQAIRSYLKGLQALNEFKDPSDKAKLYEAEKEFVSALREDKRFAVCHHNLGYVQMNLGYPERAAACFRTAIEYSPNLVKAYLNLADAEMRSKQECHEAAKDRYNEAAKHCDRAILLSREHLDVNLARAWDMRAVLSIGPGAFERLLCGEDVSEANKQVHELLLKAAALSWRLLCRGRRRGDLGPTLRALAARCCLDSLLVSKTLSSINARILRQLALEADPRSHYWANRFFAFALFRCAQWKSAIAVCKDLIRIDDSSSNWALLSYAHAKNCERSDGDLANRQAALEACEQALSSASSLRRRMALFFKLNRVCDILDDDRLRILVSRTKEILETINGWDYQDRRHRLKEFAATILGNDENRLLRSDNELVRLFVKLRSNPHCVWGVAWMHFLAAHPKLDGDLRRKNLRKSLDQLVEGCDATVPMKARSRSSEIEMREMGLGWMVASSSLEQGNPCEAIKEARLAVDIDPESFDAHIVLARAFLGLRDFDSALAESKISLFFLDKAKEPSSLVQFCKELLDFAEFEPEQSRKRIANEALDLAATRILWTSTESTESASAHAVKARGHEMLGQYDDAISHLQMACSMKFELPSAYVKLGAVYLKAKAYGAAEQALSRAIDHLHNRGNEPARCDLAKAYALLALSYAERETKLRLRLASRYLSKAQRLIRETCRSRFQWDGGLVGNASSNGVKQIQTMCEETVGLIYLKKGKLSKSIKHLNKIPATGASRLAYLYLASAYVAKAEQESNSAGRTLHLIRAKAACLNARNARVSAGRAEDIEQIELLVRSLEVRRP
jgi:tetratricopeptide (TPR) repeat protein